MDVLGLNRRCDRSVTPSCFGAGGRDAQARVSASKRLTGRGVSSGGKGVNEYTELLMLIVG